MYYMCTTIQVYIYIYIYTGGAVNVNRERRPDFRNGAVNVYKKCEQMQAARTSAFFVLFFRKTRKSESKRGKVDLKGGLTNFRHGARTVYRYTFLAPLSRENEEKVQQQQPAIHSKLNGF